MDQGILASIGQVAREYGLDPGMLQRFVQIESSGNPYARSGSYMGLLQLGPSEFKQYGNGDPFNVLDNLRAGARKIAAEAQAFRVAHGREPTPTDLYMQHQQGSGGYAMHMANPEAPAWQNMAATGEGQAKGEGWAKKAIWGNIPDDLKRQFGNVDNVTSRDFVNLWRRKVEGTAGLPTEAAATGQIPQGAIESQGTGAPGYTPQGPSTVPAGNSGGLGGLLARALGIAPQTAPAAGVLGIPGASPQGIAGLLGGLGGAPPQQPQFIAPPQLQAMQLAQPQLLQPIQYPQPIRRPVNMAGGQ